MVVSTRPEERGQNSSSTTPEDVTTQCPRIPTCSHQGSNNNGLTNDALLRCHDAIMCSCHRAIEFGSGCEDGMSCACTVQVNCTLPTDYRMTRNKISHAVQHYLGQMKCCCGLGIGSETNEKLILKNSKKMKKKSEKFQQKKGTMSK